MLLLEKKASDEQMVVLTSKGALIEDEPKEAKGLRTRDDLVACL